MPRCSNGEAVLMHGGREAVREDAPGGAPEHSVTEAELGARSQTWWADRLRGLLEDPEPPVREVAWASALREDLRTALGDHDRVLLVS